MRLEPVSIFFVGGTQTNLVTISALLQSYEAVIAAQTGHICVHDTGAIEAAGHKVCTVPTEDGKLTPAEIENVLASHSTEHMVEPRLVISLRLYRGRHSLYQSRARRPAGLL